MKRLASIVTLFLLSAASLLAQPKISVHVPAAVSVDEQFKLEFVVEGDKPSSFDWPGSSDFTLQWGPQTSQSSQTSIINGKMTRSNSVSYIYVLLPNKEGDFVLPPCTITVKGKKYSSQPTPIKVGRSSSGASSAAQSSGSSSIRNEDLFLRLSVDKQDVVIGEPVIATLKLYKRVHIAGFEDVNFPTFDGFWTQTLQSPSNIEFERQALGNEVYDVALIRSYRIIPQRSGDLVIDPARMVCQVQVRNRNASSNSIFDSFFQNEYSTVRKRISSEELHIKVRELPQPQPASFCSGVGRFSIAASLSADSLKTHDAGTLRLVVRGHGNINLIDAPKIKFPPDFELYDVKTSDSEGEKVFEYPFIPRSHGDFLIGPVDFSYFDTSAGTYRTLHVDAIPLHVERSQSAEPVQGQSSFVSGVSRDVKNLGTDIRYISTRASGFSAANSFVVASPLFWLALVLLLLASVLLYVLLRIGRERRKDEKSQRRKGASSFAKKKLSLAGNYLKENLPGAFYEELHKALLGFVAGKLLMEPSELDKDKIREKLSACGVNGSDVEDFVGLLDECEFARFSPGDNAKNMDSHYELALKLISSIDYAMNKNRKSLPKTACIALLLCAGLLQFQQLGAQTVQELFDAGVAAYSAEDYALALENWQQILESGQESSGLYYNIGCAEFKQSNLASAVVAFERALRLDPSNADARHNLEYVNACLQDRIDSVPEFFMIQWFRNFRNLLSSNAWAVFAIVFFVLALALALLFALASGKKRVAPFFCSIASLLLFALSLSCSLSLKSDYQDSSRAVVVCSVSAVRSSPDASSGTDLFVLHEGSKVKIVETVGDWYDIELSDGRRGWIRKNDLEII